MIHGKLFELVKFTNIGNIKTACLSRAELVSVIVDKIQFNKNSSESAIPLVIFDSNGHAISMASSVPDFKKNIDEADIVHADGQSVVLFSKWFSKISIPERTATTDTIHDIPLLNESSLSHFLLGGEREIVQNCSEILSKTYKNFDVVGFNDGYFHEDEEANVIEKINSAKPDILWVGLGKPKEQAFVTKWKKSLKVPVIITCGGCYNYVTGDYGRAPKIMQEAGFEWLYRLIKEPRKLFMRYLTTNPHSIFLMLKHKFVG